MAETCPQLSLCWAFACLVGQDNIFLKSLCVQEFNVWLSPRREYLLSCLCTSFCVLLCLCQSLMTPSATIRGKDSLFQELLSGPASCRTASCRDGGSGLWLYFPGDCVFFQCWGWAVLRVWSVPKKQQKGLGTELTGHRWDISHPYACILLTCSILQSLPMSQISHKS